MTRVRETLISESYRGNLFTNDKSYARNVLSVPMNLKMRLSEVYSLPLVKFLNPPTRSVLCTPRMFFLTLEKN